MVHFRRRLDQSLFGLGATSAMAAQWRVPPQLWRNLAAESRAGVGRVWNMKVTAQKSGKALVLIWYGPTNVQPMSNQCLHFSETEEKHQGNLSEGCVCVCVDRSSLLLSCCPVVFNLGCRNSRTTQGGGYSYWFKICIAIHISSV